jgi:hypothetical protein
MRRWLPLSPVLFASLLAPSIAHADLRIGRDREPVERKGLMLGLSLLPGVAAAGRTPVPVMRMRYVLGGGITNNVTLATEFGIHKPLGIKAKKIGLDLDVVLTGYLGRFFVRGGAGASTWAYAAARDPFKPGVGGLVGIGWEFRIAERLGLGIGIDYDARVRPDRLVAQTLLLGIRFTGYVKK